MDTTPVRCERRAAQRFDFHLPIAIRHSGKSLEGHGFTQDLSARGVFLYADFAVAPGDQVELTLRMPSEITLGESMQVRCLGVVKRVSQAEAGSGRAIAVHLQNYEYLPEVLAEPARDFGRVSALHEVPDSETDSALATHTFEWRGITPTVPR